jgi:hypothetical protein
MLQENKEDKQCKVDLASLLCDMQNLMNKRMKQTFEIQLTK